MTAETLTPPAATPPAAGAGAPVTTTPAAQALSRELRDVYAAHPSGVAVVAALVGGGPAGIAASTFVPVSLDPPLVSICVAHTSSTWPLLRNLPRLGVSVLADHQEDIGRRVGSRDPDRFAGVQWWTSDGGGVLLRGAAAWFDTSVHAAHRAGDHDIVVLRVHDRHADRESQPLVFHGSRFRRLG